MAEPLRHRQTKEAETDMFSLQPPRHISTLHIAAQAKAIGMSGVGESGRRIPGASVGQPTETCLVRSAHASPLVITGRAATAARVVPVIPLSLAVPYVLKRDGRDKPGHDDER